MLCIPEAAECTVVVRSDVESLQLWRSGESSAEEFEFDEERIWGKGSIQGLEEFGLFFNARCSQRMVSFVIRLEI